MCAHDRRINHLQRRISQAAPGQRLQDYVPDAAVGPASELPKDRIPVAELLRQIAPRCACSHQPKHRVQNGAMVGRRATTVMDQERFEIRPLIVGHQSANQGRPPQRAALNQFPILASTDLSTRPRPSDLCSRNDGSPGLGALRRPAMPAEISRPAPPLASPNRCPERPCWRARSRRPAGDRGAVP